MINWWLKTIALYRRGSRKYWPQNNNLDGALCLGVIKRRDKLFLPGDVILVDRNNGMCSRFPVFGLSGRGYRIAYKYVLFNVWHGRTATAINDLIEFPADSIGKQLNDPDIRQFAEALRAEQAAYRVGAGSPVIK